MVGEDEAVDEVIEGCGDALAVVVVVSLIGVHFDVFITAGALVLKGRLAYFDVKGLVVQRTYELFFCGEILRNGRIFAKGFFGVEGGIWSCKCVILVTTILTWALKWSGF